MDIYAAEIIALTLKIAQVMLNLEVPYSYSVEGQSVTYDAMTFLEKLYALRSKLYKEQAELRPLYYTSVLM